MHWSSEAGGTNTESVLGPWGTASIWTPCFACLPHLSLPSQLGLLFSPQPHPGLPSLHLLPCNAPRWEDHCLRAVDPWEGRVGGRMCWRHFSPSLERPLFLTSGRIYIPVIFSISNACSFHSPYISYCKNISYWAKNMPVF